MRKYFLIFILLGTVTSGFSQARPATLQLSIAEAQDFAIENNRNVKSARIDLQSADKKIWENLATGLPQISVAANYLHQFVVPELSFGNFLDIDNLPDGFLTRQDLKDHFVPSPSFPLGVHDNTTIDLTLSQLIFSGEYLVGLQATRVYKQMTEKSLTKTENETKESVAGTYYLILVLAENARVLDESLKSVDQTYNELVRMHEQGLNEDTDVDQVKINRSNIETLLNSIKAQQETSLKLLKFQLGLDFNQSVVLTDSLTEVIKQGNISYLVQPEYNLDNSVEYQMASSQEKISALLLKREQSKYLPTISAFYRHQEQTNQPSFNFAVKDVVGASLSIPIFTSGMRNAKVNQARFDLAKSELAKENAGQGLIMDFETARNNYQTAFSNFSTNRESFALSKKVYDRTVIKFKEGVSSSLELTQNQNQFLNVESNYYNSILTLLYAKAKLDRILSITNK